MVTSTAARRPRLMAMDALARREHSRHELYARLKARCADSADDLERVLDDLEADGLLCDRRFAEAYIRSRIGRGQGMVRIRHELRNRGVAAAVIEESLAAADVDWYQLATEVLVRRFGRQVPADYKERARCMRFLQQRGFANDEIRGALDTLEAAE